MNLPELILDLLGLLVDSFFSVGLFRRRNDRSIVGKSPIEEETERFWRRMTIALLAVIGLAAIYVWAIAPRFSKEPQKNPQTAAAQAELRDEGCRATLGDERCQTQKSRKA